jgi:serine/threonine protein kinase
MSPAFQEVGRRITQSLGKTFRLHHIRSVQPILVEAIIENLQTQELLDARLYSVPAQEHEALRQLWFEHAFMVEGTQHDLLQMPLGLHTCGGELAFLAQPCSYFSLEELLRHTAPLPASYACRLTIEIIRALEAVYAKGGAHFQITLSNIYISPKGGVVVGSFSLFDFEQAIRRKAGVEQLQDIRYASPEHLMGEDLTIVSDIFSVGSILYRMLTGAAPFPGDFSQARANLQNGAAQNPQSLNSALSVGIVRVLARAIAGARKQRFAHFGEFKQGLAFLLPVAERAAILSLPDSEEIGLDETERGKIMSDLDQARSALRAGDFALAGSLLDSVLMIHGHHREAHKLYQELRVQSDGPQVQNWAQTARDHIDQRDLPAALSALNQLFALDPRNQEGWKLHQFIRGQWQASPLEAPLIDLELWCETAGLLEQRGFAAMAQNTWAVVRFIDPARAPKSAERPRPEPPIEERLLELRTQPALPPRPPGLPSEFDDFQTRPMTPADQKRDDQFFAQETLVQPLGEIQALMDADLEQTELELSLAEIQKLIEAQSYQDAIQKAKSALERFPSDSSLQTLKERATAELRRQTLQRGSEKLNQLVQKKDFKAATQVAQGILKIDPENHLAHQVLEMAQSQVSSGRELVHFLREVNQLEERGEFAEALVMIDKEEFRFRDVPEFAALKERLRARQEADAELEWRLLEAKRIIQKGNVDGAKSKIQAILEKWPNNPQAYQLLDSIGAGQTMLLARNKELLRGESVTEMLPTMSGALEPGAAPPPPIPVAPPVPAPVAIPSLATPPAAPGAKQVAEGHKAKKSRRALWLVASLFLLIAALAGTFVFLRNQQKAKALELAYRAAEEVESKGDLASALAAWQDLIAKAPEYRDSAARAKAVQNRLETRRQEIAASLERARRYRSDGILYDSSQENSVRYYQKVLAAEPSHGDAKRELEALLAELESRSQARLAEGDPAQARELYRQVLEIDPGRQNAEFEAQIRQVILETQVQPLLLVLDKALAKKDLDEAFRIRDEIEAILPDLPEVQQRMDALFTDIQTRMEAAAAKNRQEEVLNLLDQLVRIRPSDQSLVDRRNLLNRELNNSKILALETQIDAAKRKKDYARAGLLANDLAKLDSENPLVRETLDASVAELEAKLATLRQSDPRAAIALCDQLVRITGQARHKEERSRLQTQVQDFDRQKTALTGNLKGSAEELLKRFDGFLSQHKALENEKGYQEIQGLRSRVEEERKQLQNLLSYEAGVRADKGVPYRTILERLSKHGFKLPFAAQSVEKLLAEYNNRIENYEGPVILVIKGAKGIVPAGKRAPDSYCEIEFSGTICKTDLVDKSANPVWNHTCTFQARAGQSLVVRVFEGKKFGKAQEMGSMKIEKLPESGKDLAFKAAGGWTLLLDVRRER